MADQKIIKISAPEKRAFWKLPVLFEGNGLLALEKPSHLLVSPEKQRADDPVLTKILQRDIKQGAAWNRERGYTFLDLLYTVDFEASGVVLFATDKDVFTAMRNLIGSRQVDFQFTVLSHGNSPDDEFVVDLKLAPHPTRRWMMRINRTKGKQSLTAVRIKERFRFGQLVECETQTLRPHQVRVHLQAADHPVMGDALYGGDILMLSQLKRKYRGKRTEVEKPLIDRAAIHLSKTAFEHPVSGDRIEIESPLPKDLAVALKYLRQYGR